MGTNSRPAGAIYRKYVLLLFLVLAGGAWRSSCEDARCSCLATADLAQASSAADAVFIAMVREVIEPPLEPSGLVNAIHGRTIHLEVLGRWKGELAPRIEIRTGSSDADCGYPFEPGRAYLVFATRGRDTLYTSICSRTALAANAVPDLLALGTPLSLDEQADR